MEVWEKIDWSALERMRTAFLDGTAGQSDYWQSENDLVSYDATFAQRIGWKWDYVLSELQRRGWRPPTGELLDWGCGSGIASRAFVDHFGAAAVSKLFLNDRSLLAMRFAAKRATGKYPELAVSTGLPDQAGAVLISHVLTELQSQQIDHLLEWITRRAVSVLWVEPGTYDVSRKLIAIRERIRDRMRVIAPCTHETVCGMLAPENTRHWCHHFAAQPPSVFTDPNWGRFARLAGIDLRSLPLSFLVLDKREPSPVPEAALRIIGRPRVHKASARLLACDATGVRERELTKRRLPEAFRQLRKGDGEPLQLATIEGDEMISMRGWPARGTRPTG